MENNEELLNKEAKNAAELTGEELTNATGGEMHSTRNYYCNYCDLRLGPLFPGVCPGCKNVLTINDVYYE